MLGVCDTIFQCWQRFVGMGATCQKSTRYPNAHVMTSYDLKIVFEHGIEHAKRFGGTDVMQQ